MVAELLEQLRLLDERIDAYGRELAAQARLSEAAQRLMRIRGIGATTALAIVATVGNAREFRNGRQFAAWFGLVPGQYSTGGKPRLGRITKRGDAYLRNLLVQGARSVLHTATASRAGRSSCRAAAATTRRWWRSPTRTRASPGRCWRRTRRCARAEMTLLRLQATRSDHRRPENLQRERQMSTPTNDRGPGVRLSSGPERKGARKQAVYSDAVRPLVRPLAVSGKSL